MPWCGRLRLLDRLRLKLPPKNNGPVGHPRAGDFVGSDIEDVARRVRGAAAEGQRVVRELTAQQTAVERLLSRMPMTSARSAHAAREGLYEARNALRDAITAADQYSGTATRFANSLAAGAGVGGAAGSGGGRSDPAEDPGLSTAGFPNGLTWVSLDEIDTSDRPAGELSFDKGYSPDDLSWATESFRDVVAPGVNRGLTLEDFRAMDTAKGLSGTRSYAKTYEGFLGDGKITLDRAPGGRWVPNNGYHRIWLARRLGLTHLPARLLRKP